MVLPFYPIVKENYQPIVDNIINPKVRDSLNVCFEMEGDGRMIVQNFNSIKANFVRPYLTSNNIIDIDGVFSGPRYEPPDNKNPLNYESLKANFKPPEFGQVLYELRVKTNGPIYRIERLVEDNMKLQKVIQEALRE